VDREDEGVVGAAAVGRLPRVDAGRQVGARGGADQQQASVRTDPDEAAAVVAGAADVRDEASS
jgi:hypothetical protein